MPTDTRVPYYVLACPAEVAQLKLRDTRQAHYILARLDVVNNVRTTLQETTEYIYIPDLRPFIS